ncbi:MAG: energy-coupling factor ABC transporter ATP-binding protein [Anaerolineaceae bacterium]
METERISIIQVKNLHFSYPDAPEILSDISFSVERGQKVAIAGPNGAGKTTLFLNLTGLLTGIGAITIKGMLLEKKNFPEIRRVLGMVFQSPDDQLFSNRVFEDVAYGLIYQGLEKAEIEERTKKALEDVNMTAYENAVPYHLSLGQKKRVAIATVLSMQPEVLLFDEPTMGLDVRAKKQFLQIVQRFSQTVLVATHDMKLAAAMCDRLIILDEGQLVYDGLMKDALHDTKLLESHGLDAEL